MRELSPKILPRHGPAVDQAENSAAGRRAPAASARQGQPARPLYAGRPARVPLPGHQHVARRHGADRAGRRAHRASASSPMSIISAGSKARSPAVRERLRHDDLGDRAQARQARRPAHLARQPAHPQSAGRPPPRPLHPAQSDGAADPAERRQRGLPRHRPVAVGRRASPSRPICGRRSAPRSPSARRTGRVVRHIDDGFAVEFTRLQHPDFLEDNVTGD